MGRMSNVRRERRVGARIAMRAILFGCLVVNASGWACAMAPAVDCPSAPRRMAQLFLDSRVIWQWKGVPALTADLGSPETTTSFELCIYDYQAGVPSLRFHFAIP